MPAGANSRATHEASSDSLFTAGTLRRAPEPSPAEATQRKHSDAIVMKLTSQHRPARRGTRQRHVPLTRYTTVAMSTVDQTTSTIDPDALRAVSNEIAATCAGFNLRRASRAVSQHFDHALAPTGLRMTQFTLLGALAIGGSVTINDLARVLVIDRTTLTRNLRLLRTAGHVAATTNGTGREQRISLTEDGRETLARAVPLWRAAQDTLVERFDETRWPGSSPTSTDWSRGPSGSGSDPGIQVTDASASRQEP